MSNPNTGHGHVFPRPDGVRARCGGPGLCAECSQDLARAQKIGKAQATVVETPPELIGYTRDLPIPQSLFDALPYYLSEDAKRRVIQPVLKWAAAHPELVNKVFEKGVTMTALEACDKIEGAINDLHEETATSEWQLSYTKSNTDAEHLEDYGVALAKTRAHFELQETSEAWFVSTESGPILAWCGNSPTAVARARYIAWVNPSNVGLLIARLRELENLDEAPF